MARLLIRNVTPEVYAGYWGDTTEDGVYFYNFSSKNVHKSDEWLEHFANVIRKQIAAVEKTPSDFDPDDVAELTTLLNYVEAKRASL